MLRRLLESTQYASGAYVQVLRQQQMIPSMSRPANPYDNASCESFMKTLKREEIYGTSYRDLDHFRLNLAAFIEEYYMAPGSIRHSATSHRTSLSVGSRPGLRLVLPACRFLGRHRKQNREKSRRGSKVINPKCANAKLSQ